MKTSYAVGIAFLLLAACQLSPQERIVHFSPSIEDDPARERLRLSYTNDTGVRLCFDPRSWPSSGGFVNTDGEELYLLVNGVRYFHRREQDYCPGCGSELRAGKSIEGELRYTSFDLPADFYNEPKTLHFDPIAWRCPGGLG